MEEDHNKIKDGSFLFGIGLTVSEILSDYLESQQTSENDVGTITVIDEGEEVSYDGQLAEIQTICKNEGFQLIATKYFIPINKISEDYSVWNHNEFMIIKNIDYENDTEDQEESLKQSFSKFKSLHDYFELDGGVERMNYYLYFPENILIDSDGKGLCKIVVENRWEHRERYGEHED